MEFGRYARDPSPAPAEDDGFFRQYIFIGAIDVDQPVQKF